MPKKGRSSRAASNYDPTKSLMRAQLQPELEPLARQLYEQACCGSRSLWGDLAQLRAEGLATDKELAKKFYSLANAGMRAAQREIVDRVSCSEDISASEEVLYRGVGDAIAWQFLDHQLCHARRMFKEQAPPSLKHSNFESVVRAANHIETQHPDSMPLITDLTSFVQVGDIFASIPGQGMVTIEVKEGEENKRIADFLKFYSETHCDRALELFVTQSGPKSVKQLGRMLRQVDRMSHFQEVVATGQSRDPDTGHTVRIPDEKIFMDTWDEELRRTLENDAGKGWLIDVIDDCLFLGAYFDPKMIAAGHVAFNSWFDHSGGTAECPRARLVDAMRIPLALPLFSRHIPEERIFDLLFGRVHVCLGVNVEALLTRCKKEGLKVEPLSRRTTSQLQQKGLHPYLHNGQAVSIGDGSGNDMVIYDGIFLRMLFHGQRPVSLIQALLNNAREEDAQGQPNGDT